MINGFRCAAVCAAAAAVCGKCESAFGQMDSIPVTQQQQQQPPPLIVSVTLIGIIITAGAPAQLSYAQLSQITPLRLTAAAAGK